jgi:hypothetical protein
MNNKLQMGLVVTLACVVLAASTAVGQHLWKPRVKVPGELEAIRPITVRPQSISGGSNGLYCPDMSEDAVGVHDLGWLPSGRNVTVIVESNTTSEFDPVAAVVVATVGQKAGNSVKTNTFYDNDSGGDKNAKVSFVTPQNGTYLLLVTDYPGTSPGCYRYQVDVR